MWPAADAVRQTAECFLAGSEYGDCVATETVRTAVPSPVRALRKPVESPQRVSGGDRDVCSGRYFPLVQGCCTKYVVSSLLRGGQAVVPLPSRRLPPVRHSGHLAVKSFRFQPYDAVCASYVGFPCADSGCRIDAGAVRRTTFGMLCRMRRMLRHTQWQNFDECKKWI